MYLLCLACSALRDMRRGSAGFVQTRGSAAGDATGMYSASDGFTAVDDDFEPRLLVERAAGHESGIAYDLMLGATLGRGDVEIRLDDPFASSRHAQITRQGHLVVIEDLGSTNGTYLNE